MPLITDIVAPVPAVVPSFAVGLVAIPAGAYTEIVKIEVPTSASAGEFVPVIVTVKNNHDIGIYIAVTGLYNSSPLYAYPDYYPVGPGDIYPFAMSFTMPNHDVRVQVFSHYWTGTNWYQDDSGYVDVALVVEWVKVASAIITLTPIGVQPPVWVKLATKTITITPKIAPSVAWVKLASAIITLTPIGVPPTTCKIDTDCPTGYTCQNGICVKKVPPEEKKFPWTPVLIGGGALIAIVGLASAERKK